MVSGCQMSVTLGWDGGTMLLKGTKAPQSMECGCKTCQIPMECGVKSKCFYSLLHLLHDSDLFESESGPYLL